MKKQVRVLGIDDSPFTFQSKRALLVGVVARLPTYIEGIMRTECDVDGTDANAAIEDMVMRSRYREQLKVIMLDGVAVGGFNVVDIDHLYRTTGIPCATVTRALPNYDDIEDALRTHFKDWKVRLDIIKQHPLYKLGSARHPIYATAVGIGIDDLEIILKECTVVGALPEPLRIAHLISSAMVRGESHGRA
ncbi:MAG: DUF99 family protein [Euryarchaeota archaeon]|nr:DUF99 family protein [Euryarchaeota archaeon]